MSTVSAGLNMLIPSSVNLSQFTDCQRGNIFIWFLTILFITVILGIKVVSGQFKKSHSKYQDQQAVQAPASSPNPNPGSSSIQNLHQGISKSQILTEQDTGTVKVIKTTDKLNTILMPMMSLFALNLVLGVTYSFSLILYFLAMLPALLFNLLGLHKRFFDHRVFICICENAWVFVTLFWFLNVWVTGKFLQPYYLSYL